MRLCSLWIWSSKKSRTKLPCCVNTAQGRKSGTGTVKDRLLALLCWLLVCKGSFPTLLELRWWCLWRWGGIMFCAKKAAGRTCVQAWLFLRSFNCNRLLLSSLNIHRSLPVRRNPPALFGTVNHAVFHGEHLIMLSSLEGECSFPRRDKARNG